MTKLEKLRDQEAREYVNSNQCEVMDTFMAHENTFKAGWDKRDAIAKEREAKLVEALEYYATRPTMRTFGGLQVSLFEGDEPFGMRAREALADHKRMMEGQ